MIIIITHARPKWAVRVIPIFSRKDSMSTVNVNYDRLMCKLTLIPNGRRLCSYTTACTVVAIESPKSSEHNYQDKSCTNRKSTDSTESCHFDAYSALTLQIHVNKESANTTLKSAYNDLINMTPQIIELQTQCA
jgi:hypothetical protein